MNPKIKRTDQGIFVMVDDTHLSRWVEQTGRLDHERDYLEQFRKFVPVGGTVIDCGTSIGDHTVVYADWVGPSGKVIGFEANPDVYECCCMNLGAFDWAKVYNIGLSDDFGVAGIEINHNVGASRLTKEGREVKLAPLDSFLPEIDRCDFIKVDIEGCEPKMLSGAKAIIAKYKPRILLEINVGALELQGFSAGSVYTMLANMGYKWLTCGGKAGTPMYEILAFPRKK